MISLDAVIPVYNEAHVLEGSISTLRDFLQKHMAEYQWRIVIADNASTDRTLEVAQTLAAKYPDVVPLHIPQKGRGRALRAAWLGSQANILSYMDVDLSTGLEAYPPLIGAIAHDSYDIAIGSRLMRGARIQRSLRREVTSRGYNLIIKAMMFTRFSDAQCGFKAISQKAARILVPLIENQEWFFDTELLILAEKKGYRIKEVPVRWVEDLDTRVKLLKTIAEDLRGLWRLRTRPIP